MKELKNTRIVLKSINDQNNSDIFELRSNPKNIEFIPQVKMNTLEEVNDFVNKRIASVANNQTKYWTIHLLDSSETIGTICLWNFDIAKNTAEVGYALKHQHFRKGIMSSALKLVVDYAFNELKLAQIEAYTHKNNIASVSLLQKSNFQLNVNKKDADFEHNLVFEITNTTDKPLS